MGPSAPEQTELPHSGLSKPLWEQAVPAGWHPRQTCKCSPTAVTPGVIGQNCGFWRALKRFLQGFLGKASSLTPQDRLHSRSWEEVVCEGKDLQRQQDKTLGVLLMYQHARKSFPLRPNTCLVPPAKDLAASPGPAPTGSLFLFCFVFP